MFFRITLRGTPNYVAPEVIRDESYTTAVDLWAVGVLLFELVLGTVPHSEVSIPEDVDLTEEERDERIGREVIRF